MKHKFDIGGDENHFQLRANFSTMESNTNPPDVDRERRLFSSWTRIKYSVAAAGAIVALVLICLTFVSIKKTTKIEEGSILLADEILPKPEGLLLSAAAKPRNRSGSTRKPFATTVVHTNRKSDVCLTKGCVKAAASVIATMDESVDPCVDFYEFSCGGFIKDNLIPDDKSSLSQIVLVRDELYKKLRMVLTKFVLPRDSHSTKIARNLYKACINVSRIEEVDLNPLRNLLNELGGWPLIEGESWPSSSFSWINYLHQTRQLGLSHHTLFFIGIFPDLSNSTHRTIWIDEVDLGLEREYLIKGLEDSTVKAHLKYSIEIAKLLGADSAEAEEQMKEVAEFQMKLAEISLPREERRNYTKLNNKMSIAELSRKVPSIPWLDYLNRMLPKHVSVDINEEVVVANLDYLTNMTKIFSNTPNRTLGNYLSWRVAQEVASFSSEEARDAQLTFLKELSGKEKRESRWKECVKLVSKNVPFAVGSLYVKAFFKDSSKTKMEEIISYLRESFDRILRRLDWMDETTRKAAIEKSSAIRAYVGYPSEILSEAILDDYYRNLSVTSEDHMKNNLAVSRFTSDYDYGQLRERVNKTDWKLVGSAAVVNAFYSSQDNSIQFPAGFLQGIYFDPDRPNYMNFGAIGNVVGHEITHGFDDGGKQFDKEGNLKNWWQSQTEEKFKDKANCIIWQYGNFTAPENGMNLNGINTQGENIADNGGIKEAYHAYESWVRKNGEEELLPGLMKYNQKQLLWLATAQLSCSKYRDSALKYQILTGYHSPGRFRTMGPFRNREEFSRDWNCRRGTPMNPPQKCDVW